jgi:hypothetical protein
MRKLAAIKTRTDNDQTDGVNVVDVRFYCTTNRIVKRSDGTYVNKDRNLAYSPKQMENRFASYYSIREPTLMITMTWGTDHSEIQICPWFLRKSRGFKFTDIQDTSQSFYALLSRIAIPVVARVVYKPIGALVLMDKVIVHELTHTSQAFPATVDMSENPYGKYKIPPLSSYDALPFTF